VKSVVLTALLSFVCAGVASAATPEFRAFQSEEKLASGEIVKVPAVGLLSSNAAGDLTAEASFYYPLDLRKTGEDFFYKDAFMKALPAMLPFIKSAKHTLEGGSSYGCELDVDLAAIAPAPAGVEAAPGSARDAAGAGLTKVFLMVDRDQMSFGDNDGGVKLTFSFDRKQIVSCLFHLSYTSESYTHVRVQAVSAVASGIALETRVNLARRLLNDAVGMIGRGLATMPR
jgi:hypothetical protein